ncbi:hypothetical protein B7P43_G09851 [Cryptotermes secundus]|uniref:Protein TsetseEP domain-containing protein n=1 Tax=Cryptotermes secundus TaxID=105785 RepID=A0A2J7PC93_9NEOP|nr:uncharacterized protein LOC111874938 [Cryptotermes secundus]PNF13948.1 hypothetical protein B7P43_G09851 [Cryptotermes secundus]
MAVKIYIAFFGLCTLHVASSGFLGSAVQTVSSTALTDIQTVIVNLQNVLSGSGEKAEKLLQKLMYKSSNPEGIQGLVKEINMAISQAVPANATADLTPCFDAGKPNISDMVHKAGEGAQTCYRQADAALQPYRNNIEQTIKKTAHLMVEAKSNLTSCVLALRGLASCAAQVNKQVSAVSDSYVADSDFQTAADQVATQFQDCSIAVQDEAIATAVSVIRAARQCVRARTA